MKVSTSSAVKCLNSLLFFEVTVSGNEDVVDAADKDERDDILESFPCLNKFGGCCGYVWEWWGRDDDDEAELCENEDVDLEDDEFLDGYTDEEVETTEVVEVFLNFAELAVFWVFIFELDCEFVLDNEIELEFLCFLNLAYFESLSFFWVVSICEFLFLVSLICICVYSILVFKKLKFLNLAWVYSYIFNKDKQSKWAYTVI